MKALITNLLVFSIIMIMQAQNPEDSKGFLPKEFKKLWFGMSFDEFKEVKKLGMFEVSNLMDFRVEYIEKMEGDIKYVTFYFDKEGSIPLYELIIEYRDESTRDKASDKLFGAPNSGEEWIFAREGKFNIKAWKFQKKLVIAAVLPETEWDE